MKYRISTLLWIMFVVCVLCAVLQRPIRCALSLEWWKSDFGYGILTVHYWLLWLCYQEDIVDMARRRTEAVTMGQVFGFLFQVLVVVSFIVGSCVVHDYYAKRHNESG